MSVVLVEAGWEDKFALSWANEFGVEGFSLALPSQHFDPSPVVSWGQLDIMMGSSFPFGTAGSNREWRHPGVIQVTASIPVGGRGSDNTVTTSGIGLQRRILQWAIDELNLSGGRFVFAGTTVHVTSTSSHNINPGADPRFAQRAVSGNFFWNEQRPF